MKHPDPETETAARARTDAGNPPGATPKPAPDAGEGCIKARSKDRQKALKVGDLMVLTIMLKLRTRTVGQSLEIGRILSLLKAFLKHGEFKPTLTRLGLQRSTANRLMASARVFSRMPNVRKHALNESMLFELLPLGVEQLEELERTGCMGALKLVDMPRMTVQQLRQAVGGVGRTGDGGSKKHRHK